MSRPTILVIDSDDECRRILLNAGLLGMTKPTPPANCTRVFFDFRQQRKTWHGAVLTFAGFEDPADNGFQIVGIEHPITPEKLAALELMIDTKFREISVTHLPEASAS